MVSNCPPSSILFSIFLSLYDKVGQPSVISGPQWPVSVNMGFGELSIYSRYFLICIFAFTWEYCFQVSQNKIQMCKSIFQSCVIFHVNDNS